MGKIIRNGVTLASFNYGTGSQPTLITKSITTNDTYNAVDDNADGYSSVSVNVPSGNFTDSLFDGTLIANKYIKNDTGVETTYNGWSATDYLDVSGITEIYVSGDMLQVSATNRKYNAWYDSSKATISTFNITSKLTVPSSAKYLRLSCTTADITGTKLFVSFSS